MTKLYSTKSALVVFDELEEHLFLMKVIIKSLFS